MHFDVKAVAADDYANGSQDAKANGPTLDKAAYARLWPSPARTCAPATYKSVEPNLFDAIVDGTAPEAPGAPGGAGGLDQPVRQKGM